MALRIWVTRHGDRTDYEMGIPAWQAISNPNRVKDPPLSALGRQQAVEMGKEAASNTGPFFAFFLSFSLSLTPISFSSIISPIIDFEFDSMLIIYQTRVETSIGKIDRIITSPFLRCLETARPLSLSLNLPLLVDYSLFEGELISLTTLRTNSSRIISSYTQIIFLGSLFC